MYYSSQSQVLINGRVSSGNAFAIKTVLNQTCKSIGCRDHLGNKGAAERTRLIIQQKNKEAMNCRGADIFTLTKNGKTTVHCQNHSSCSPQFPNTYTALKEDMMQKLFQNLLLALKRDIFFFKKTKVLFLFLCVLHLVFLYILHSDPEKEKIWWNCRFSCKLRVKACLL